ncbi:MAG: fibronectin type III domain-containing protein, partial [Thermoplasmatota archaeon]
HFYCLYTSNGTQRWRNNFGGGKAGPVITEDDIIYHVSGYRLVAMDLSGNIIWRNDTLDTYISSPAVGHDGTIYVGSYDNHLYAVYPNNGTVKWGYGTGGYISTTPAIDKDDSIYFGCWDGYFYALNQNGTLNWKTYRQGTTNNNWHSSPVIDSYGEVYVIDPAGNLCKYTSNGSLIHQYYYKRTYSTPTIDSEDIIYVPGKTIYAVYPNNSLHIYIDPPSGMRSSPVFGPDGTIYLTDGSGTLTAIGKQVPLIPILTLKKQGNRFVKINWTVQEQINSPGLESIRVYRKTNGNEFTLLTNLDGSATQYNDTTVVNGIEYEYRVIAVNKYGESEPSNIISAIPLSKPDPPINVSSRWGSGFIEISWEPPEDDGGADITGYQVWKRREGNENFSMIVEPGYETLIYNDTSVVNGELYEYYVTAVNSEGNSLPSEIVSDVPKTVPGPPFINVNAQNGFVLLEWVEPSFNGGSEITGFSIYRGVKEGPMEFLAEMDMTVSTFNDSSVTNGIPYRYHMTCMNMVGESEPSLTKEVIPKGEPTKPLDLTAVSGDEFVHLYWSSPLDDQGSEVIGYIIHVSTDDDGSAVDQFYTVDGASNTYYNDTDVVNGRDYTYYVTAWNSIGRSKRSNEITITPGTVPSSPSYIGYSAGDGFVRIYWSRPDDDGGFPLTSYSIFRQEDNNEFILIGQVDPDVIEYNDTDVKNGVLYTYYIIAENSVGRSLGSEFVNARPESSFVPTPPARPNNLVIDVGEGYVLLRWEPPEDDGGSVITEYYVYRSSSDDSFEMIASVPAGDELEFNDTDVESGSTYFYQVTAVNAIGESSPTANAKAELPDGSSSNFGVFFWLLIVIMVIVMIGVVFLFVYLKVYKGKQGEEFDNDVGNNSE